MSVHPIEQISFDKHGAFLIEASAGTGKTWTLERLYIKALLEATNTDNSNQALGVENILVVTFTNDAVNELKSRIYKHIQETIDILFDFHNQGKIANINVMDSRVEPEDDRRGPSSSSPWLKLEDDRRLDMDYLHECIHCDDSNTLDGAAQFDDVIKQSLDVFTRYLQARAQSYDIKKDIMFLTRALQRFDIAAIYTIHKFCSRIINNYPFYFAVDFANGETTNRDSLIKLLITDFIREKIITNKSLEADIAVVMQNLNSMFGVNYLYSLENALLRALPKDLFHLSIDGLKLKYKINVKPDMNFLTEHNLDKNDASLKAQVLSSLIDYLVLNYPKKWQQLDNLSFDEIIQAFVTGLANSSELCDLLYKMYPVTFIDEFQDTDNLQWQIFSSIYGFASNDKLRGSLVAVGDPKQAIYNFRGADVEAYINARREISRLNTDNLNLFYLNNNFRSHHHIMNFVNVLFDLKNQNNGDILGNAIDYLPSVASSNIKEHNLPSVPDIEATFTKNNIAQKSYAENVQIVVIDGKTKPGREHATLLNMTFEVLSLLAQDSNLCKKIAILVSSNNEANKVLRYFRKYGVRATELKTLSVFSSGTARDLAIILDALLDLNNATKVMQAFISNILGVKIENFALNNSGNNNGINLKKHLFEWKLVWDKNGILALAYKIINDINFSFQHKLTNRELSNILQLAELLNAVNHKKQTQVELLLWLKSKIRNAVDKVDSDTLANEELMRLDNDDEQVVITTHHKAKGLEYDIVFCPFFRKTLKLTEDALGKKIPYFKSYYKDNDLKSEMLLDKNVILELLNNEAKEIQRLNYVALTRAKSRLYIYLKQHTMSKAKYNYMEVPEKIVELFGYNKNDPLDTTHKLFSYPDFFAMDKTNALKDKNLFPGVVVYSRNNLNDKDLQALKILQSKNLSYELSYAKVSSEFVVEKSFTRQSYTSITKKSTLLDFARHYEPAETPVFTQLTYKYKILNDPKFSGAVFGVLFHELCEEYPLSDEAVANKLNFYNIPANNNYVEELQQIIQTAFRHKLMAAQTWLLSSSKAEQSNLSFQRRLESIKRIGVASQVKKLEGNIKRSHMTVTLNNLPDLSLNNLKHKFAELKFNIKVTNTVALKDKFSQVVAKHFGAEHKFSKAIKALETIESGFLVGAIDLFFEYGGKYWILDYKTNKLEDYTSVNMNDMNPLVRSSDDVAVADSKIIESMAEHHYYLQYIIYLVVVKRHLENRLGIDDATHLLGGAIYYYVRGLYTNVDSVDSVENKAVYVDMNCQNLIRDVDELL